MSGLMFVLCSLCCLFLALICLKLKKRIDEIEAAFQQAAAGLEEQNYV